MRLTRQAVEALRVHKAAQNAERLGLGELWIKNDAANPTHSFKDRVVSVAVARARELVAARGEVARIRQDLENRKVIERAKGILMRRTGTTEQEAYRILQRTSQDRSVSMVEIAKAVLESEPGSAPAKDDRK